MTPVIKKQKKKIMVSLPVELIKRADKWRKPMKVTRSFMIEYAIEQLIVVLDKDN